MVYFHLFQHPELTAPAFYFPWQKFWSFPKSSVTFIKSPSQQQHCKSCCCCYYNVLYIELNLMMTLQHLNKYQHVFEVTFVLYFTYITLIQFVITLCHGQQSNSNIIHVLFPQVKSSKYKVSASKCYLTSFL